jgi:BlaI family transcriptional regulator, penicillinase repressor
MRPIMPERHQLTELQLAILRILWDKGEATVQDIWEALHAERGLAQTTVATMLSRLERRGVVTRRAQSRQYRYRAAVTEQEVQHSMIGELTERLFDGDVTALVQHLLAGEDVSPGDIAKIRDMIERVEPNAPESK